MRLHELAQDPDRSGVRDGVGIGDEDELVLGVRRPDVRIPGERQRPFVLEHADARRKLARNASGDVRDEEQLVDLLREERQRACELFGVAVRDDDGGHLHASRR